MKTISNNKYMFSKQVEETLDIFDMICPFRRNT